MVRLEMTDGADSISAVSPLPRIRLRGRGGVLHTLEEGMGSGFPSAIIFFPLGLLPSVNSQSVLLLPFGLFFFFLCV